jgi:hypothetical protein
MNLPVRRAAPLTGAASTVLYFVGFGLIGQIGQTASPSPDQVVNLLEDGPVQILIGAYISLVSVVLLLLFAATLRSRLRVAEGGTGQFSAAAMAGGVVAAASMSVGFASIGQAALRAEDEAIDPLIATVLYDLYRAMLSGGVPIGFAVLIGATAIVSFRGELLPSWLAWTSVVIAVGAATPLLALFAFVALIWVFVVSIWLSVGDPAGANHGSPRQQQSEAGGSDN